ncbi:MAG: LPXTG cell wall anchor domain-containing protein [Anaerolineae bacterium]|jgi:LPXTG-motif cell wall-anchored protein|nr:LPXTG cell wall anchor domain-containing protein [Anaerolineae bacterium]
MDFIIIFLALLMMIGAGILFFKKKNKASLHIDDSPREHESLYEMPAIRMTDEGELTDSFIVEIKTLKKYRDELVDDDKQE